MNPTEDTPTPDLPEYIKEDIAEIKQMQQNELPPTVGRATPTPLADVQTAVNRQNQWQKDHSTPIKQDDKQLREAILDLIDAYRIENNERGRGMLDIEPVADKILALFQKEQLQLVSELEGELPEKEPVVAPIGLHELEAELNDEYRGHNKAIDKVTALLEHKKQELEGKQDV